MFGVRATRFAKASGGQHSGMFLYCRQCGARLEPLAGTVGHTCKFEELMEFQLQCAHIELEHGLEAQVETWAREPRVARRLEFARYVRNRTERRRQNARPEAA
jgi:hypothetical protein